MYKPKKITDITVISIEGTKKVINKIVFQSNNIVLLNVYTYIGVCNL